MKKTAKMRKLWAAIIMNIAADSSFEDVYNIARFFGLSAIEARNAALELAACRVPANQK